MASGQSQILPVSLAAPCSGNARRPITCNGCRRCGVWPPLNNSPKAHHSGPPDHVPNIAADTSLPQAYEEALQIYRDFAKIAPDTYEPYVQQLRRALSQLQASP